MTQKVSDIRERIANRIGDARYRTWFGDAADFHLRPDGLDVVVTNAFVGNWIASNYLDDLVATASEVIGPDPKVEVHVSPPRAPDPSPVVRDDRDDEPPQPRAAIDTANPGVRPRPRGPRVKLRGTIDDFVVGAGNKLAHSAALSVVRSPGQGFKLLIVHGGCGLGKTHLLQGICNGIQRAHPALEWRYISGEEFTNEFIYAVKSGHVDLFRARFRNVDVLIIDDIHFLANKKGTQSEFLHTFNAIDASGKAVVLSSDRHPRHFTTLAEPLADRLIAGMVVEIEAPDEQTRLQILKRRAARMNARIPEEVLELVARRITRNVRELEGALFKLVALASLTRGPVSLELATNALEEHIAQTPETPSVDQLLRLAGSRFGVSVEQIESRSRDRTVSLARAVGLYFVRKHTCLSFPEIGRNVGNKNHSTILMAVQRVERQLCEDATVTWKTANGTHKALLRGIIEGLERERSSAH